MSGTLYLLPTFLSAENLLMIPPAVLPAAEACDFFIVENARTTRRYLRSIGYKKNFDTEVIMYEMNKHSSGQDFSVLKEVATGKTAAILSEAGMPCVADPGFVYVARAHALGINVIPISGPNSLVLALAASGFSGNCFTMQGYLPVSSPERKKEIRRLEEEVISSGTTQIFIETPYRNQALLQDIVQTCRPNTMLCLAVDITLPSSIIRTQSVVKWKEQIPDIHKKYTVFLLGTTR
jgi:16S rRNA (cytidine1402-2'-O)-methyltransferase